MEKIYLLDAYALIYRAYYALIRSPRINSKGENTSAAFGFVNTLEDILRKENPDYIAVAFDPSRTFAEACPSSRKLFKPIASPSWKWRVMKPMT